MRTLLHRGALVTLLSVLAAGILAGQIDVEALRAKAEQGDAGAQFSLGNTYLGGQGVPQDYAEALKWYQMAAEQGHADAQALLGQVYLMGRGVPQDHAEAAKWFRMAAEQGDTEAQRMLGIMYGSGQGVPQDYVRGHMWVNLAAATLQGEARENSAKARELLAGQMTSAQIAEAQRLAREWKPKTWEELKKGLEAESR